MTTKDFDQLVDVTVTVVGLAEVRDEMSKINNNLARISRQLETLPPALRAASGRYS